MAIKDVLRSKRFLLHLVLMVVATFVLFWVGLKLLDVYTRHGTGYVVPDYSGMLPSEIGQMAGSDMFHIVVSDSVYDNSRQGGIVIDQEPKPGSEVKRNRTIHLTIISTQQEMVPLPDLGNTMRSARSQLEAHGLRLGEVIEVKGEFVGLLQRAFYMGREIDRGEMLPRGATVDIEVMVDERFDEEEELEELDEEEIWHGSNDLTE